MRGSNSDSITRAAYSPRCMSWMRLLFPAQRRYADHFIKGEWEPHVGGGMISGTYVSRWSYQGQVLYTAVNRRPHAVEKHLFTLPFHPGCRWVDVISGQEWEVAADKDGEVEVRGYLSRNGLAGLLPVHEIDADLHRFLQQQRQRFASADWTAEPWEGEHRNTELPHVELNPPPKSHSENERWHVQRRGLPGRQDSGRSVGSLRKRVGDDRK